MNPRIFIFSCGYNCVDYVDAHINSIHNQYYGNYIHRIIDDGSNDGTYEKLVSYAKNTDRYTSISHFSDNRGSIIQNYAEYLKPEDDDIVAIVDLDDYLIDSFVFEYIVNIYNNLDCWMTHGSFIRLSNGSRQGDPYPDQVKYSKGYRDYPRWLCQHLRTFKGFLWNNVNTKELIANKEYLVGAVDMGLSFPMLEMCKPEKIVHIPSVLYVYNDLNSLNEFKIKKDRELKSTKYFRSLPKYKELNHV